MIYDEDPFRRRPENRWPGENDRRGVSEWREKWPNGIPSTGQLPKSCYRMASKEIPLPWRWDSGTISTKLELTWEMSDDITAITVDKI